MNKELTTVPSKLMQNKLGVLARRLQQQADPTGTNVDFNTLEKTVAEAVKILSEFYRRLSEPNYKPVAIVADTVPDAEMFNENFQAIADDLEVVFAEFENLESVILGSFNYMISRMNRLNGKMKTIYSNLGDYILYADLPTKDAIFFQDSFNDLSRVDMESSHLALEQCEVNQIEGVVTLPVDLGREEIIRIENVPVISENSNGRVGNNEEAGAEFNGNLAVILDNNADTWVEYERVVSTDDGEPLVMDFTLTLRDAKVLNFIRINPNNFGTKTQVEIVNIDTSTDGASFLSIKDDIPIADFVVEDEENIFTLAPSTSKYAGQGLYTFTPRRVKFIRISLRQSTPYSIVTEDGIEKSRYAIGIRDIEVRAIPYKEEGEIISTAFNALDSVRKVALSSNQRPDSATTSLLASIEHYVSPDDGISWYPIRPLVTAGVADLVQPIPEVLDFNGIGAESIQTNNEVNTLRYKAVLRRYPKNFVSDAPELAEKIVHATELHSVSNITPFKMTLQHRPIDGSIEVVEVLRMARGRPEARYPVAKGTGGPLQIQLPFEKIRMDWDAVDAENGSTYVKYISPFKVYVDGIEWTRGDMTQPNHYRLNHRTGLLRFSDGNDGGTAVPSGAIVSLSMTEERLRVGLGKYHAARLAFPTATDKSRIVISVKHSSTMATAILEKGATLHKLLPDIDTSAEINFSENPYDITGNSMFTSEVTFVDGESEFTGALGEFSVDYEAGYLYSSAPTSTVDDISVTYNYFPRTILGKDDWDFVSRLTIRKEGPDKVLGYLESDLADKNKTRQRSVDKNILAQEEDETGNIVSIKPGKFTVLTADDDEVIPVGRKRFTLKYDCLVPGSLKVIDLQTDKPSTTFMKKRVRWGTHLKEISDIVPAVEHMQYFTPVRGVYGTGNGWWPWEEVPLYKYTMKRKPWVRDGKWAWLSRRDIFRRRRTGQIVDWDGLRSIDRYYGTYTTFGMEEDSKLATPTIYIVGPWIPWWRWWWRSYYYYLWWWRARHMFLKVWKRDFGKITYYWKDPRLEIDGRYAVNWKTGEVDLAEPCTQDRANRYRITYKYTSYYAKYDVCRSVPEDAWKFQVPEDIWDFDENENAIVMKDSDRLRSFSVPMTTQDTLPNRYYQVSYERVEQPRADVSELEQFFTPVLKDYALKVVTKSRLI